MSNSALPGDRLNPLEQLGSSGLKPLTSNHQADLGRAPTFAEMLRPAERRLRWFIIGWITLSTILNLINRNTLSILAPTLKDKLGVTEAAYGHIIMAFQLSYAIMYIGGGRLVDRVGEKLGMAVCIIWWSISTILHAFARGVWSLGIFRFLLGIGEPGNYPAALRASARWFSREERGLPIAIWSSGSSVGSLVSVPLVAFLAHYFGWRTAFLVPGLLGLIWVAIWLMSYSLPSVAVDGPCPSASSSVACSAQPLPNAEGLLVLLKDRKVWIVILARLLTDPIWVFYLSWTPKYLAEVWKFDLVKMGLYGWIPFLFGGLGGVFGGMASDWLIRRGMDPATARKRLLYLTGAIAPLGMLTGFVGSAGVSIALIALMAFVCYVWFIDTAVLMSDIFPERVVGSVLGLAAGIGQLGGILMAWLAGHLLETGHSYTPLFFVAGSGHLLAALLLLVGLRNAQTRRAHEA
jgi:ACS family hexuronate transporter-like MFS transporter